MRNLWQACLWQLSQFNRLHQSFPGRWRLCAFIQRHSAQLASLPAGPTKVARDTFLYLNPQEKFDGLKTIIHGLNPREPLSNVALQLLRPGDNALDVGANVGYFSALAAMAVGEKGQVFAFEASPSTYERLQTLVKANAFNNIKTFEVAVSDQAGELQFHCGPPDHTGTASLRDLADRTSAITRVKAVALDDLLDTLPTIRLIKIDVEGAETLVAQGMSKLIERDQPYILTEVTDNFLQSMGSSKASLIDFYLARGYSPYRVQRNIVPYREADEYQCDVLMVPRDSKPLTFDADLADQIQW